MNRIWCLPGLTEIPGSVRTDYLFATEVIDTLRDCCGPPSPAIPVRTNQSIAACTRFATRSRRSECQGSGLTKLVK